MTIVEVPDARTEMGSLLHVPSWLGFAGGRFTGTPSAGTRSIEVRVTASDGSLTTHDDFVLAITATNRAPVVARPLSGVTVQEDAAVDVTLPEGNFTDPDGNALSLSEKLASGTALPSCLRFDGGRFTGTPPTSFNGALDIAVTASDGRAGIDDVFRLTVPRVNDAHSGPTATLTLTSLEDAARSLVVDTAGLSDIDEDTLSLAVRQASGAALPSWLGFANGRLTGTPPANYSGTLALELVASDGTASAAPPVSLVIAAVDDAPTVAAPLAAQAARAGTAFDWTIPSGCFADVDGVAPTLTAKLASRAAVLARFPKRPLHRHPAGRFGQPHRGGHRQRRACFAAVIGRRTQRCPERRWCSAGSSDDVGAAHPRCRPVAGRRCDAAPSAPSDRAGHGELRLLRGALRAR